MKTPIYINSKDEVVNDGLPEIFHVWNGQVDMTSTKVKTTENVSSSGYLFKIYDVKNENHMLAQLKPLLFTIRLLFRFPYVIDENGRIKMKWFSKWTVYTVVGYLCQALFALELMWRLFSMVSIESDFVLIVKIGVNILAVVTLLYTPFSAMMEWKAYCIYFNQWIELQIDFTEITGNPFTTHLGLLIKISIGVIAVQSYVAVYMGTNTLTQPFWYHKYVYLIVFLTLPQQLFLWIVCQYESSRMGSLLKKYIIEVFGSDSPMNNASNAVKVRMLWLRLVYVVKLLGHAAFTIIVLLTTAGVIFLAGTYVILSGYVKGDSRASEFVGPVLISALLIMVICEFSHRTTVHVGADICEALVNLKSSSMDHETTTEVERFLRIAAFNAPAVSVAGLANIDRSTLVAICKNVITYLIVLIQFQMTNDEDDVESLQGAVMKDKTTT